MWRGECSFIEKAANAQAAGAAAVIVVTDETGALDSSWTFLFPSALFQNKRETEKCFRPSITLCAELSPMSCVGNASVTVPVMQVLNDDGTQLAADAGQGECFRSRSLLQIKSQSAPRARKRN